MGVHPIATRFRKLSVVNFIFTIPIQNFSYGKPKSNIVDMVVVDSSIVNCTTGRDHFSFARCLFIPLISFFATLKSKPEIENNTTVPKQGELGCRCFVTKSLGWSWYVFGECIPDPRLHKAQSGLRGQIAKSRNFGFPLHVSSDVSCCNIALAEAFSMHTTLPSTAMRSISAFYVPWAWMDVIIPAQFETKKKPTRRQTV